MHGGLIGRTACAVTALACALSSTPARADDHVGDVADPKPYQHASQAELDAAQHTLMLRPHPHRKLPGIELLTAIAGGFIWYWADESRQVADWDFPSIKQRFTGDAWKYDTNPFPINWAWHSYDGAQYHLFARANDLSMLEAMAYGIGTSVAWEFTVEFREQVSINDVILTSTSGTVIGEYLHWLGRYFESAPEKRWWHPYPRYLLTTNRAVHNKIFGYDRLRKGTVADHLGFSSDIWHRFELSTGLSYNRIEGDVSPNRAGSTRPALGRVLLAGDLAALPGYLTASSMQRNFTSAQVASARLRLEGGEDSFALDYGVDTFMIGHHRQHFDEDGSGDATTFGLNVAYRYRRELFGPYVQRLAQTHLPGLALDEHLRFGDVWLRGRVRANYDFIGSHALAYRDWRAAQPEPECPDSGTEPGCLLETSVVHKHKFYFGWGPSTRLDVMVSAPHVSAGAALGLAKYHSARGYDRRQVELTDDLHISDRFIDSEAWVRVGSKLRRTYLEARLEQNRRRNSVEDVTERTRLTSFLLLFGTEQ